MKTLITIALLLALVVMIVGVACLSRVLPGVFAFAPWAAGCVAGWCVGEALGEIWKPETL